MLFPLSQKDNHKQLNIQDKPLRHERTMTLKSIMSKKPIKPYHIKKKINEMKQPNKKQNKN